MSKYLAICRAFKDDDGAITEFKREEKSTIFEGVEDVFADAKYNKKHVSEKHKDRERSQVET